MNGRVPFGEKTKVGVDILSLFGGLLRGFVYFRQQVKRGWGFVLFRTAWIGRTGVAFMERTHEATLKILGNTLTGLGVPVP